eukprot:11123098-Alexandrium_andersonii.AAC.1
MSASLVGSEMCIRDRARTGAAARALVSGAGLYATEVGGLSRAQLLELRRAAASSGESQARRCLATRVALEEGLMDPAVEVAGKVAF